MVEQEGLEQVCPLYLYGHLLKQFLYGQVLASDFILDENHLVDQRVQVLVKCINGFL